MLPPRLNHHAKAAPQEQPTTRSGAARVAVALLTLGQLWGCSQDHPIVLTSAQQEIVQKNLLSAPPQPEHAVDANYGGVARLLGYDLSPASIKPGQAFDLTWYWESLKPPAQDWMIFVHIEAAQDQHRMNLDHHAVKGLYDIRSWKKGEHIRDEQKARLPKSFPAGEAKIWVGLWRAEDRLPVEGKRPTDGNRRLHAGSFQVIPSTPPKPPPLLRVPRIHTQLQIDGRLDEAVWDHAARTGVFGLPRRAGRPKRRTEARLLWNSERLYVAFECEDPDAWSTHERPDSRLWEQDVVEIFIDPNGDAKNYVELQVSPANVLFDASFSSHRSNLQAAMRWDSGAEHGVHVDGSLNQREDTDRRWSVELAIPWKNLPAFPKGPAPGTQLRANLFRLDKPAKGHQDAGAWSAPLRPDFHALDRFGTLELVAATRPLEEPRAPAPALGSPAKSGATGGAPETR